MTMDESNEAEYEQVAEQEVKRREGRDWSSTIINVIVGGILVFWVVRFLVGK